MDLFSLAATLTLDASSYNSGITSAESKSSKFATSMNKAISVVKKLAGAAVIGKAAKSLKNLADSAAAAGDKIDKQSQALGISRKAYQEWDYILSQSGSSIDSLGTSMKTLNNSILSGKDSVKKLGLSFDDLKGMNMEQQFEAVVRAFQQMPEGAEKSALAVELFGRNGMELLPLLNSTSDTIDQLRQKFADLGIEMTDKQIEAAVNYSDSMDTLKRTFDAVKYAIGAELLPVMTEWADKAAAFAGRLLKAYREDGILGVFSQLDTELQNLTETMRESGNPLMQALAGIIDAMRWTLSTVVGLFTDFDGTVKGMKESDSFALQVLGGALEVVKGIFEWISEHGEEVAAVIAGIVAAFAVSKIVGFVANLNPVILIITAIGAVATYVLSHWEEIKETLVSLWEGLKETATVVWEAIKEFIVSTARNIKTWLSTIWDNIKNKASEVWKAISTTATDIWNGIKDAIVGAVRTVKTWLGTIWDNIKNKASEVWNAIKNTATDIWNSLKETASRVWEEIRKFITDPIGYVKTKLSLLWENIQNKASEVWNGLKSLASTVWESIKNAIHEPIKWIKTKLGLIWDNIKSKAESVWNAIKSAIEPIINGIASVIEGVAGAIQDVINWWNNLLGVNKDVSLTTTHTVVTKNIVETVRTESGDVVTTYDDDSQTVEYANGGTSGGRGFAKGLWNVPYDMTARIHRGETILSPSQARKYRDGEENMSVRQIAAVVGVEVRKALKNVGIYMGADKVADITADRMNDNISAMNTAILHGMGGIT